MNRRLIFNALAVAGVLASLGIAARVFANAPADQYSSFVATDTTITDRQTRLTWERAGSQTPLTTEGNALAYCIALGTAGGGWRLPTENELLTLVDEVPHQQYEDAGLTEKAIDQSAFPTTVSAPYATMTAINSATVFMGVDFTTGIAAPLNPGDARYARCVRPCVETDGGACTP